LRFKDDETKDSPSKVLLLPCNCPKSAAPSVVLATDWAASASEVKLAAVRAWMTCCCGEIEIDRSEERVSRKIEIEIERI
jgi:hypothetical protein